LQTGKVEMKAMIFAAGKGTRLLPVTEHLPKALVEVHGKTLLQIAIEKLTAAGFDEIIINIHHHAGKVRDYLNTNSFKAKRIEISDETDLLLETGGGLKKAAWFFNDGNPFLLYNVDVLTNFNLAKLLEFHTLHNSPVTLAVSNRKTSRYLLFDEEGWMKGWTNEKTGDIRPGDTNPGLLKKYAFSGIHMMDPEFIKCMNKEKVFSLIDTYINCCHAHKIGFWEHEPRDWIDVGKPEVLKYVNGRPQNMIFNEK
jgi:NDP-sugar pyrophosphorylase family protein